MTNKEEILSTIHTKSIIEQGASIGQGTNIGECCHIGNAVTIGKNNTIGSHTVITGNTTIGDHNHIDSYTVLGTDPQDLKVPSDLVSLCIGDNNHIGSYSLINVGTDHGGGVTKIGNNNKLMKKIHLGHDVQMGDNCLMEYNSALGGHVIVGNNVCFMDSSAVHQFVEIGDFAYIAKDTALTQDIPPYCKAKGNRAKVAGINLGILKDSFSDIQISKIATAYSHLFDTNLSPKDTAVNALEQESSVELKKLYQFIVNSKRGIPFKRKTNVN